MHCKDVHPHCAEYLDGTLTPAAAREVAAHLRVCPDCAEEMEHLRTTWDLLGAIKVASPDSAVLRARVDAAIAGYEQGVDDLRGSPVRHRLWTLMPSWHAPRVLAQAAVAAVLIIGGVLIGRQLAAPPPPDPQIVALRDELRDMRQLVTLSLMQQPSASERLKGVTWTSQIEDPGREVVTALLDALMHDPNVNVRLASIGALERFAGRELVRRGAVDALGGQTSPLLQMALIDFVVAAKERESVETLRRLSADTTVDDAVRARAAWGLEQLTLAS